MIDVSIVIVSWNTRDLLYECLTSLKAETQSVQWEAIVIDNCSVDGSAAMIRESFPWARMIVNVCNRGFAAANNQGIEVSCGRYVLLLNPDTVILDGAVEKSVAYMDVHSDVGVLGCQVLEAKDRIQPTCFMFPSPMNLVLVYTGLSDLFSRSRVFGRAHMSWWDRNVERDVDVVSGMFMLVRSKAIREVGLMDEDYFVYGEEADWCFRFQNAGWRRVFAPIAQIIHCDGGGKSTIQLRASMYVQMQKSLLIFMRKHRGVVNWLIAKVVIIAAMMARSVYWSACLIVKPREIARRGSEQANAALSYHILGKEPLDRG